MEKEILVLNCANCGEDFLYEYRGSGRKPIYCENCKKAVLKEAQKGYQAKYYESITKQKREEKRQSTTISRNEKGAEDDIDQKYCMFVNEISRLLTQLDTTRVELCNISKQMYEYQSDYDKNDQTFLHQLEQLDTTDIKKTTRFVADWKNSRGERRNMKDLISLVGNAIDSIPYKNYANAVPILKGYAYNKTRGARNGE